MKTKYRRSAVCHFEISISIALTNRRQAASFGNSRGFTGHEQVDYAGIIHMNGRIYDPKLGRMLQADPFVQDLKESQSLNRYSYALNNPLSHVDPTGYFSFSRFIKKWGRVIVAAVAAYFTFGWASSLAWSAMPSVAAGVATSAAYTASAVIGGAVSGFVGAAIVSGSLKGAVKGAFLGGAFAYIGMQIRLGIQNWQSGRGEVWRVRYDAVSRKLSPPEHISDPTITQIDKIFVNGQSNELSKAIRLGYMQLGEPSEFFVFHNPTHGFIADTVESALGKLTNTSSISRQLAAVLEGQAQSLTNVTAHSQGGIIVSNALRHMAKDSLTTNTIVNFNGAAVGPNIFSESVLRTGARVGAYQAHWNDAVPNILGLATGNPVRILGSVISAPLLFISPLSPHSVYVP